MPWYAWLALGFMLGVLFVLTVDVLFVVLDDLHDIIKDLFDKLLHKIFRGDPFEKYWKNDRMKILNNYKKQQNNSPDDSD